MRNKKVYRYLVKNPAVKTYRDLNLHLNPLLADNKDVEAARVSKFLNGDKLDISAALSNAAEICHGEETEKYQQKGWKLPKKWARPALAIRHEEINSNARLPKSR